MRIFNRLTSKMEEFSPAGDPRVVYHGEAASREQAWASGDWTALRAAVLAGLVPKVLTFLGFRVEGPGPGGGADLYCGLKAPAEGAALVWVSPGAAEGGPAPRDLLSRGLEPADFAFHCLQVSYRNPLPMNWEGLAGARDRRAALARDIRILSGSGSSAASPAGVHPYRRRLSQALAGDLDCPGALGALWDALRPGALSPGSRLEIAKAADSALGLGLF